MTNQGTPVPRFDGHRLRNERAAVGLTRKHVATAANLTGAMVKAMEHNRVRPSDAAFARLCNVLGLSADAGRARLLGPGPADPRPDEYPVVAREAARPRASMMGLARRQRRKRGGAR